MNIVLIVIDTLRYDHVGANGSGIAKTPNLDRLASESWCFDRAFCASYPTIPHRTDVMTGRYGGPFHPWRPLRHDALTLPRLLSEAGYATQLIHDTPHLVNGGHNFDWPFHAWTQVRGAEVDRPWLTDRVEWPENWRLDPLFDCLDEDALENAHVSTYARANRDRKSPSDWNCARLFRLAARFARENARREDFLLWIDCFDPHEPWDAPPEFVKRYVAGAESDGCVDPRSLFQHRNDKRLSGEAKNRIRAQYAAKVAWMDHCLGVFLDELATRGLAGNTAVIVTSDHGTNVGERGCFGKGLPVREQEAHIPLFARVPGAGCGRCRCIVQPQGICATVLELAGTRTPASVDGVDILRAAGQESGIPRAIALSGVSADNWEPANGETTKKNLFTVFSDEWCLEFAARPEDCRLSRLGSIEQVENDHPDVVEDLRAIALDELARRGTDSGLLGWIQSGTGALPDDVRFWDGWPGPAGFKPYFDRLYTGA